MWFNIATSDRLSFASLEIDKNVSLTPPRCKSLCHRWSRAQGLSPNDKWRQSLGTRLACFIREQRTADATFHENSAECVGKFLHPTSRVFPYTSFVLYRFLRALQQNRAQSRLLYLLIEKDEQPGLNIFK